MRQTAPAHPPQISTKWTVLAGPMAGSVRLMNSPQFTIGRSPDCEFVIINDPKCSRHHARIQCEPLGCQIHSLNERNLVLINGQPSERGQLSDGDVITLGTTEVQFNMISSQNEAHLSVVRPQSMAYQHSNQAVADLPKRSAKSKPRSGNKIWIYAILGLVGVFILLPSKGKKKEIQLRMEQQIQADIETAKKLRESSEAQALRKFDQGITSRQAQENYVRGFRDYKKGQYERALMSFQACLALNPEHILCNRYIRLSKRKFDELIQYEIVLGRKYRDQGQYKACRASFRNVMVMVKDANSPVYQEAHANYQTCDTLVEGRF